MPRRRHSIRRLQISVIQSPSQCANLARRAGQGENCRRISCCTPCEKGRDDGRFTEYHPSCPETSVWAPQAGTALASNHRRRGFRLLLSPSMRLVTIIGCSCIDRHQGRVPGIPPMQGLGLIARPMKGTCRCVFLNNTEFASVYFINVVFRFHLA